MISSPEGAIALARAAGVTIATAESLTGGLVSAALTSVPGASDVFVGGVTSYALGAKEDVLGVPAGLLAEAGPVSEAVALAMAHGARNLLGADVVVSTTGAAGPEPHGGKPAGMFCIAVSAPGGDVSFTATGPVGRDEVRAEATIRAIAALCDVLDSSLLTGTSVG
jgi:nicotinamide-nucleotide amidase